jgi:hypothetical protein
MTPRDVRMTGVWSKVPYTVPVITAPGVSPTCETLHVETAVPEQVGAV